MKINYIQVGLVCCRSFDSNWALNKEAKLVCVGEIFALLKYERGNKGLNTSFTTNRFF